ncbi:MAG: 2-aminoethylphosphonate--pyruvate transaminase [Holophaga sp.]|nr:2-aminoethylphosphonate--pyruvate transaminase [Holophaga sp.]
MRDPILLTPGPLTTSLATKVAMLNDWGSWDAEFNALTAHVCHRLAAIVDGGDTMVCVPMQGSGTYAVEAAIGTLLPPDGKLLVLVNGAYGQRMARLTAMLGRDVSVLDFGETSPVDPARVAATLARDPAVTHVGIIHCETSTGILNPLEAVARAVQAAGRRLIVDAMSSFAVLPISAPELGAEAVIASSNKGLEGVPGLGFVLANKEALLLAKGRSRSLSLDLYDQYVYMQKTGRWRFTPPTHVVAALSAALDQFEDEGGRRGRLARYSANCERLLAGLAELGLKPFLPRAIQAPVIVTVCAPDHPRYSFPELYDRVKTSGFVLYPGKLTEIDTFRVGCIGAIGIAEIDAALAAIGQALKAMGISAPQPSQA